MDTLLHRISQLARLQPDKLAAAFKKDVLNYRELYNRSISLGQELKALDVRAGDRVCFTAVSKPETIVMYLGIQSVGAVTVFLDKNANIDNMLDIYRESSAVLLITDKPLGDKAELCRHISMKELYAACIEHAADTAEALGEDFDYEAISEILFTSGTTGRPKGVMLSYKAVYNILSNTREGIHIREDEVVLLPLPLHHSYALRVLRAVLYSGASVILQNGFTFARAVEDNIRSFACTAMACVPTSYEVMRSQMQEAFSNVLGGLRYIDFGAGSLTVRQRKDISALLPGVQIYNTWGSSETGGAIFCDVTECVRLSASAADISTAGSEEHGMDASGSNIIASLGRALKGRAEVRIIAQDAPIEEIAQNYAHASITEEASAENGTSFLITGVHSDVNRKVQPADTSDRDIAAGDIAAASEDETAAADGRNVSVKKLEDYFIDSDIDHPGRMLIKGDMKMSGYWNDPDRTRETIIGDWLVTGDIAYMDKAGNIYMLGRADDIINVGGEKVSPIEVENLAGQYAYVKECACIGVEDPDGIMGQIPVLFVVPLAGYDENELIRFISARTERCKLPQRFVRIDELPRNRMQKLDRRALKSIWEDKMTKPELSNPVIEAILARKSIRKFTESEVSRDILDKLVECGYYAPSGHNLQSWRFTVLTREADILKLKETAEITAKANNGGVYGWFNPKAVILISNDERDDDGAQDTGCAAENIMLAAHSLGLGSVWLNPLVNLRKCSPLKELLDSYEIPENHIIWASIALGYPEGDPTRPKHKTDVVKYV